MIITRSIQRRTIGITAMGILGVVLAGCGEALPSSAPLSPPTSHQMTRARPSSTRAVENDSEEHPHIETDGSTPNDDDDDDSERERVLTPANPRPTPY